MITHRCSLVFKGTWYSFQLFGLDSDSIKSGLISAQLKAKRDPGAFDWVMSTDTDIWLLYKTCWMAKFLVRVREAWRVPWTVESIWTKMFLLIISCKDSINISICLVFTHITSFPVNREKVLNGVGLLHCGRICVYMSVGCYGCVFLLSFYNFFSRRHHYASARADSSRSDQAFTGQGSDAAVKRLLRGRWSSWSQGWET